MPTPSRSILRGLTTVAYQAADHAAAKAWYTRFLGLEPYFDRPGYAEFRIGDYQHELGIIDAKFAAVLGGEPVPADGRAGSMVYWHVDDVDAAIARATELGATLHHPPRDFGEGFVGASVVDPFGNLLGFMYNPHYLEVLRG